MVTNDFQGRVCDRIFEKDFDSSDDIPDMIACICKQDGCVADWIVLSRRLRTRSCSAIRPFVYFENSSGELSFAGRSDDVAPEGYQRKEITTYGELQAFEKRLDSRERSKIARNKEAHQEAWENYLSEARRELRREMEEGRFSMPEYDENTGEYRTRYITIEQDDSAPGGGHSPAYMREAMRIAQERVDSRGGVFRTHDPGVHLFVLHNDEDSKGRFSR